VTSRLEGWIEPRAAANPGRSGFRLLSNGLDAFVARGALIDLAQRSLDLQYYIWHADSTGSLVIDRLVAAADRGVRVRILLDDWGTAEKKDDAVAALDAHPNIEIRLFNPYQHRSGLGRITELLTSFARVNRRMHNKQLIADDTAVVLGGRNIGDEYFALGGIDFQDVDVLGGGPIARESAQSFESYWSSPFTRPISSLGQYTIHPAKLESERAALRERVDRLCESPYAQALQDSDLARAFRAHDLQLHWGESKLLSDPPEKLEKPAGTQSDSYLSGQLRRYVGDARSDMLMVSPYFVPGARGLEFFRRQRENGVGVKILTNSLAATDVWLVHAGYRKYRRPLLKQGVELFELKPETKRTAGLRGMVGSSRASLHGKTFVLDRASVFVGSVNLDPRSLDQNTEDGVVVHSPALAGEVAALFEKWASPDLSYAVRLGSSGGGLQWSGRQNGTAVQFNQEPQASLGRRLGASVFSYLPIESLI
jgi:putative cardiolipin synthase